MTKPLLVGLLLLLLVLPACGGDDDDGDEGGQTPAATEAVTEASTESATEAETSAETQTSVETEAATAMQITPEVPAITPVETQAATGTEAATSGERVPLGTAAQAGPFMVTVESVIDPVEIIPGITPESGHRFIALELVIENTSDEQQNLSTVLMMKLKDSSGQGYDIDFGATASVLSSGEAQPDGPLPAGETMRGKVGYQVPADLPISDLTFQFTTGLLDPEITSFALE